jgi:hypothetical protein
MLVDEERLTVESPISAKLLPDEDRWKTGCCGRPYVGARDVDLAC